MTWRVADIDGKQGENCGFRVRNVDWASVTDCTLYGPCTALPLRRMAVPCSRAQPFGLGHALWRQCRGRDSGPHRADRAVRHREQHASAAARCGGRRPDRPAPALVLDRPRLDRAQLHREQWTRERRTGRRIGRPARFGGVAGTDQNVGEMILFEGNHRTAYFGPLADANSTSVTLPATLPDTPDNRLGSVERKHLAHDAQGHETPFWPPDVDDGTEEPPIGEYYVTIFSGRGQGQTRRVRSRAGQTLRLDHPWTVPPQAGSVVAVGTMFYQNLIVDNHTPDGMTGIQLWISCVENVISGNTIARQRKPGLYLYANGTTLASSMPRTWNRGISPLFWNVAEGNRTEECTAGAL